MPPPNAALCLVPGCPHWTARYPEGGEWICAEHWRLVPRHLKTTRTRLVNKYRRLGELELTPNHYKPKTARCWRAILGVWRRMRRAALEGAAGL